MKSDLRDLNIAVAIGIVLGAFLGITFGIATW